ncbi:MAG: hypothetical protein HS109_08600 [Burkholderiales bacterium]|nr:hypothetical protein [Burkholderiales bacterium]
MTLDLATLRHLARLVGGRGLHDDEVDRLRAFARTPARGLPATDAPAP